MAEKYKAGAEHRGKYVTYIRVSTNRQGLSGLGLEAQTKAIDDYLNGGDWEIIESFEEVETGTNKKKRPQLMKALELCEETGATLLVAKIDRLARNVAFVSKLLGRGVKLGNPNPDGAMKLGRAVRTAQADEKAEEVYAVIERIRKLGVTTLRGIGEELQERKVLTPLGKKKWGPEQVKAVIQRVENNE